MQRSPLWMELEEKKYDPLDATLKLVQRMDELDSVTSEDGDGGLRAEMSCGHAVAPDTLTRYCRIQLDQGKSEFRCPALIEGDNQCNKVWSYQEVRRLAYLTIEEMEYFEVKLARLTAERHGDIRSCPQCKTVIERMDSSNLCFICVICRANQKKHHFCWQCLKPWKGKNPWLNHCDNDNCVSSVLRYLQTCATISLPDVKGVKDCPSVRACPSCGMMLQHNRHACKNLTCPSCQMTFCFICLKSKKVCLLTSSPYKICSTGIAPRQTSIPERR